MNKSVTFAPRDRRQIPSFFLTLLLPSIVLLALIGWFASRATTAAAVAPASGETCTSATVINPAALPFVENSSTLGAGNDIDPTAQGCVEGAGLDVSIRSRRQRPTSTTSV